MNEVDELLLDNFNEIVDHSGIKGMKWGVRRQRRNEARARAGVKGGFKSSRIRTIPSLGPVDFIKGRGIRGGAARKAVRVQGQLDRKAAGKATTMDLIKRYGSTRVTDLIPVREKNAGKVTTHKADIAIVTAAGALFALRMINSAARAKALG